MSSIKASNLDIPSFIKDDVMLHPIYVSIIHDGEYPDRQEAITMLRFFASFSIGCHRLQLYELAEVWNKRTDLYFYILLKCGYKYTRKVKSNPLWSVTALLTHTSYYLDAYDK